MITLWMNDGSFANLRDKFRKMHPEIKYIVNDNNLRYRLLTTVRHALKKIQKLRGDVG